MDRSAVWEYASIQADEGTRSLILRVPVSGENVHEWKRVFEDVAQRHSREVRGGKWGVMRYWKTDHGGEIHVREVAEGSEEPLREFVDFCVGQANKEFVQAREERRRAVEASSKADAERQAAAERMTARLRESA